jgi:hypothetical protein
MQVVTRKDLLEDKGGNINRTDALLLSIVLIIPPEKKKSYSGKCCLPLPLIIFQ